jgi:type II secretory pathway component PulM
LKKRETVDAEQTLVVEVAIPAKQQMLFQSILLGEDGLAAVRSFDADKSRLQLWTSPSQKESLYDWLASLPQNLELQVLGEKIWIEPE